MIFLLCSSLLFFSELLHMPNSVLVYCLECITYVWHLLLSIQQPQWLIGFVKLPIILLCSVIFIALWIVSRRVWRRETRIAAFMVVFGLLWSVSYMARGTGDPVTPIACNKGSVFILHDHHKTIIIDPGYIGRSPSAASWVQYTLVPQLIQLTGSLRVDYVIVLQPGSRVFEALGSLCTKVQVQQVYMPWWDGTLSRAAWRNFFLFKELLVDNGGVLKRFGDRPIKIPLSDDSGIRLLPLPGTIAYHEAQYRDTHVEWYKHHDTMTFNTAKHKEL